ncbi:pentapeptide repeat-containing protein [Pseudobacteriovorax antillogorgiicola]|uniref:Pentapeptide repeat-containing protein n=1 Tax=Pseudobacteriovorax antillogorgiicola TaxID=1513793 RepID=A0A1Y6CPM7_9BACT|nr:pentapeptide repeat-containing protein [Pseudobacteriovorax antillogorgiicola]TCS46925.1 pentapeptide repeat protein [Pseudobacteriovorax antillogorgiicola]SMF64260.1 Pentapeptide repeat-containing protein [Pseudobacteriovorax antillogorgiicola]
MFLKIIRAGFLIGYLGIFIQACDSKGFQSRPEEQQELDTEGSIKISEPIDEGDTVSIPANISGTYLSATVTSDETGSTLAIDLLEGGTKDLVELAPGDTVQWQWNSQADIVSTEGQGSAQFFVKFVSTNGRLPEILNTIVSYQLDQPSQNRVESESITVSSLLEMGRFDSGLLLITPFNLRVEVETRHNLTPGNKFVLVRGEGTEPPEEPRLGTILNRVSLDQGPVDLGESRNFVDDPLLPDQIYTYQLWEMSPDGLSFLLGEWKTRTGSSVNETFDGMTLSEFAFFNSRFERSSFRAANLSRSNLARSDLSDTDLTAANFSYVNLRYANLTGADLNSVNLSGADLSFVTWVDGRTCAEGSIGSCL